MLSGCLRLILGERDFTIKSIEVVEFSTWAPHRFGTQSTDRVEAVAIFGPHGERVHLHTH